MSPPADAHQLGARQPGDFHVLVVDDEIKICESVCELIKLDGFRVTGVVSGQEALTVLQKTSVDLVLTDLMMPGMNGWQLLQAIKKSYKDVRVVVFTGYISEQAEAMLTSANVDGYLTKPVEELRLVSMLKALLLPQNLGKPAEVVVVDNDSNSLRTIEVALSERGLFVHSFRDANKAVLHIRSNAADLVVAELILPGVSGIDLCQTLRSFSSTSHIPVLLVTGQPSREVVMQAIQLGVKGFVAKPLNSELLGEKAMQVLRQAGKG